MNLPPEMQLLAGLAALLVLGIVSAFAIAAAYLWLRTPPREPCSPERWVVSEIDRRLTRHRQRREVDALLVELQTEATTPTDEDDAEE